MHAREADPSLSHPAYRGVRLAAPDSPAGCLLSTEAQWNQTEADWRRLLAEGRGFGFDDAGGALVASTVVLPYGDRFGWIGMVLVTRAARRQGLATLLLRHALEFCGERRLPPLLDATPAGRAVYASLGFSDLRRLTRWRGEARGPAAPGETAGLSPSPMGPSDIGRWAEWDEPRFGACRRALLRVLRASRPDLALQLIGRTGEPRGFCLGRAGRMATQIGPLVAATEPDALVLLRAALSRAQGPVLFDLGDGRALLEGELKERGFRPRRAFTRMHRGAAGEPGQPQCVFASAGPEWG